MSRWMHLRLCQMSGGTIVSTIADCGEHTGSLQAQLVPLSLSLPPSLPPPPSPSLSLSLYLVYTPPLVICIVQHKKK